MKRFESPCLKASLVEALESPNPIENFAIGDGFECSHVDCELIGEIAPKVGFDQNEVLEASYYLYAQEDCVRQ